MQPNQKTESHVRLVSRAVIISGGRLLLCRARGAYHTFLPGGGINCGEAPETAVAREIREELGLTFVPTSLLATLDNEWMGRDGRLRKSKNFIFAGKVTDLLLGAAAPKSQEPHLEFVWASPAALERHILLPESVRELARALLEKS